MALGRRSAAARADRKGQPRILRKDRKGANPVLVGVLMIVLLVVGVYFGFTKNLPLSEGFRMQAVFENANSIRAGSPVRIAGVNVGKVTSVERYVDSSGNGTNMSAVEIEIKEDGLPIHTDATAKIRPRIFLEGNFFVDLKPGTPGAGVVGDGDTLPVSQTAAPVQLGDVLTSLQADTRRDLQDLLRGFGDGLNKKPRPEDDARNDPDTRGETAGESLNDAAGYGEDALRDGSVVNEAFLGGEKDDLRRLIDSLGDVTGALGRNETQLTDLLVNFNVTLKALGDEGDNLRATLRGLPPVLRKANVTFDKLNAAFPSTRAFARELIPGARETPATLDAAFPWIRQTRALVAPDELQGLVGDLSPAVRDLAVTVDDAVELLGKTDLTAKCFDRVLLPAGDIVIDDGAFSTGQENYKEFFQSLVGFAGEGQNFDGNGPYVRFNPGRGPQQVTTGNGSLTNEPLFGNTDFKPLGTRPAYPGKLPPYKPNEPCFKQGLPDLNGAKTGPGDSAVNSDPTAPTSQISNPFPGSGSVRVGGTQESLPGLGRLLDRATQSAAKQPATASSDTPEASGSGEPTLSSELLDRLNPFREDAPAKKAKP